MQSVSDGERYVIIILGVSLVLHGEAIAHVRILHVQRGSHDDTQIFTHLTLPRLWTCRSSSALMVRIGGTPIYAPFRPQCNFMVSIIKRPPALELFLGAPILEIIR